MTKRQRVGLAVAVRGLRLAALGTLTLWFIPTREYEATDTRERTYFGLGWPDHWVASEVTLEARVGVRISDGAWVPVEFQKRGPLTAWDPVPNSRGPGDSFEYRRWKRENPLYGPLWQTGLGVVCWVVARYLNQFRRPKPASGEVR